MRHRLWMGCVATTMAMGVSPPSADACGNEVYRRVDPRVMPVARAEKAVEKGDFEQTVKLLARASPRLRTTQLQRRNGVTNRSMRVMAKVVARTGGAVPTGIAGFPRATAEERAGNVKWAHRLLANLALRDKDDPTVQTELAEITAHIDAREAFRMLSSLEERDLLTSAWGYRALLQLRRKHEKKRSSFLGIIADTALRPVVAVEQARCTQMAEDDAICDLDDRRNPRS